VNGFTFSELVECAPSSGQIEGGELTGYAGRRRPMAKHRCHSIEFKRQLAQVYLAGDTLHGLAKRHDISRNLIRVWVARYEAGAFDEDARAADLLQEYEAKIAALERLVGRQALELEFLKGASRNAPRQRSASTSVISGPLVSPSATDAV
jgi:transposase